MKKLICVLAGLCAFSASYAAAEAPAAAGASAAAYEAENAHRPANTQMSFFIAPPACQSAV